MSDLLKYKMYQHEETPPPGVWDAIAVRLDDDEEHATLAGKMTVYETKPPANAWDHIAASLDTVNTGNSATIIPIQSSSNKRKTRWLVAAVMAGLVILTAWWLLQGNNKNRVKDTADNTAAAIPQQDSNHSPAATEQDLPPKEITYADNRSNNRRPANRSNGRALKYAAAVNYPSYNSEYPIIINSTPIHEESSTVVRDRNQQTMNGDYLIISAPNGDRTRISSKFANVIRYLNDDDAGQSGEAEAWKKRFQDWRKKIMQSAFIPSTGNFLDIADLKELVEENQ